jgi:hypothetical protein
LAVARVVAGWVDLPLAFFVARDVDVAMEMLSALPTAS